MIMIMFKLPIILPIILYRIVLQTRGHSEFEPTP